MATKRERDPTDPCKLPAPRKRAHAKTAARAVVEAPPPRELLPLDLLLEIAAGSDAATVVRCAAACRPLRRAILNPDFRRRVDRRAAANGGFDPAALAAVSYQHHGRTVVHPSRRLWLDCDLFKSFKPACSRDGLFILCWNQAQPVEGAMSGELRAYDTFIDRVTNLPRTGLSINAWNRCSHIYRPALLAVDGSGRSFELLVMDWRMQIQTFSSPDWEWSAVRQADQPPGSWPVLKEHTDPTVVGRTVHWLWRRSNGDRLYMPPLIGHAHYPVPDNSMFILSLHADTAEATAIELPDGCLTSTLSPTDLASPGEALVLAATAGGTRLSVVAAEGRVISMWTLSPEQGWSRQVVIHRSGIGRQLATANANPYGAIRFEGFGERSGTVVFWMKRVGFVQLNLGTKKAVLLRRYGDRGANVVQRAWLHEIDLVYLLGDMKVF